VLFNIGQHAPISANRISQMGQLEKSKISRAISKLEERGWLSRQYSEDSRRSHDLLLTEEGKVIFDELTAIASQYTNRIEEHLGTAEVETILKWLRSFEKMIVKLPDTL